MTIKCKITNVILYIIYQKYQKLFYNFQKAKTVILYTIFSNQQMSKWYARRPAQPLLNATCSTID